MPGGAKAGDGQRFGADSHRAMRPDARDRREPAGLRNRRRDLRDAVVEGADPPTQRADPAAMRAGQRALFHAQLRPGGRPHPLPARPREQAPALEIQATEVQLRVNPVDERRALRHQQRAMADERRPLALSTASSRGQDELVSTTTSNGREGASSATKRAGSSIFTRTGPSTRPPVLSTTTTFTYLVCASIPAPNTLASLLEAH